MLVDSVPFTDASGDRQNWRYVRTTDGTTGWIQSWWMTNVEPDETEEPIDDGIPVIADQFALGTRDGAIGVIRLDDSHGYQAAAYMAERVDDESRVIRLPAGADVYIHNYDTSADGRQITAYYAVFGGMEVRIYPAGSFADEDMGFVDYEHQFTGVFEEPLSNTDRWDYLGSSFMGVIRALDASAGEIPAFTELNGGQRHHMDAYWDGFPVIDRVFDSEGIPFFVVQLNNDGHLAYVRNSETFLQRTDGEYDFLPEEEAEQDTEVIPGAPVIEDSYDDPQTNYGEHFINVPRIEGISYSITERSDSAGGGPYGDISGERFWVWGGRGDYWTITATPLPGYVIPEGSRTSWTITLDFPEAEVLEAVPQLPEVRTVSSAYEANIAIPRVPGVQYFDAEGNNITSWSTLWIYSETSSEDIIARPASGYEFPETPTPGWRVNENGDWVTTVSWEVNDEFIVPVAPTQTGNRVSIPLSALTDERYDYFFGGDLLVYSEGWEFDAGFTRISYELEDGEHITVSARPDTGYEFTPGAASSWNFSYSADSENGREPVHPTAPDLFRVIDAYTATISYGDQEYDHIGIRYEYFGPGGWTPLASFGEDTRVEAAEPGQVLVRAYVDDNVGSGSNYYIPEHHTSEWLLTWDYEGDDSPTEPVEPVEPGVPVGPSPEDPLFIVELEHVATGWTHETTLFVDEDGNYFTDSQSSGTYADVLLDEDGTPEEFAVSITATEYGFVSGIEFDFVGSFFSTTVIPEYPILKD